MSRLAALVMAAGKGERFGELKQFIPIKRKPAIVWSVEKLYSCERIDRVVTVVPRGYEDKGLEMLGAHGLSGVEVVTGGDTRQESVRLGLGRLKGSSDSVIVHDAVRPCFSMGLVDRLISALDEREAVVPVFPVVDTLVKAPSSGVDAILDRADLYRVQTPQGFRTELICEAHRVAEEKGFVSNDDGSLVLFIGREVETIPGEVRNLKITFREDVETAETLMAIIDGEGQS